MRRIKTLDPIRFEYEAGYISGGRVSGTDEAGRGPLAGPVSVATVAFPREIIEAGRAGCLADIEPMLNRVNDSKKLSEQAREELFDVIKERAEKWSVRLLDSETIDRINILEATKLGMADSIRETAPRTALIDAVKLEVPGVQIVPIIKGDALSFSIGAASILAKVTRDRIMADMDREYPQYGFAAHKGYGTAAHIAAIREFGLCPIHRRSFCRNFTDNEN